MSQDHPQWLTDIAVVCHEANRAWCLSVGDTSQPSWADAEPWQREGTYDSVRFILDHPDAPDSALHERWADQKRLDGWVYGPIKDASRKTHDCLVDFNKLPLFQQRKDSLFFGIVRALSGKSV